MFIDSQNSTPLFTQENRLNIFFTERNANIKGIITHGLGIHCQRRYYLRQQMCQECKAAQLQHLETQAFYISRNRQSFHPHRYKITLQLHAEPFHVLHIFFKKNRITTVYVCFLFYICLYMFYIVTAHMLHQLAYLNAK